jgi:hypothetical protein
MIPLKNIKKDFVLEVIDAILNDFEHDIRHIKCELSSICNSIQRLEQRIDALEEK